MSQISYTAEYHRDFYFKNKEKYQQYYKDYYKKNPPKKEFCNVCSVEVFYITRQNKSQKHKDKIII